MKSLLENIVSPILHGVLDIQREPIISIPDGALQFEDSENYLQFEDSTEYLQFETV